jgi:ABC-2 type transport system permease protein
MESVSHRRALAISFRLGFRRVLAERAALVGQILVFGVLVVSYTVLFQGIAPATLARYGLTPELLVWYFVTTQVIVGCCYYHYRDLEQDIRDGGLEILLLRPLPFWWTILADWAGQYTARVGLIAPFGLAIAAGEGNILPPHFLLLLPVVLASLWLGGLIFLGWQFMIACAALWCRQSEPVFRFWQKTLFFLGARSWPLLLYPLWAQAVIAWTPFPAVLAIPGGMLLGKSAAAMGGQLLNQLGWLAVTLLACAGTTGAVRRRVQRLAE